MNLFGKKREVASAPSDPTPIILKLRETLETLDKREIHLQKKIKGQLLEAKQKSLSKDKKAALFALKRKKMYEGEINKINGARMTLEQQVIALEGSNMNYQTFRAMQIGAKAMKDARGQLDVDDVDTVMDDIQEEMDIADQISDAIARPADGIFDDDDLLAELAAMDELEMETELLDVPPIPKRTTPTVVSPGRVITPQVDLPDVPRSDLSKPRPAASPARAVEEDPDILALQELSASMM